jgi:membrane protease YdiL (CAAX protease family)
MKQKYPTITQANLLFLIISILLLAGSSIFIQKLGIGTNLWINEFIWILTPVLILTKAGHWSSNEVFKFQNTVKSNKLIAIASAVTIWFFSFYLSKSASILLNTNIGILDIGDFNAKTNISQGILIFIGMIVLAPICEEILFRGLIQSAYEKYNKKYSFIYSAVLFGMFHILNGITEVLPTFVIGLVLGYLVYRTGSIVTSMLAHMAFNMSALFFNGAFGLSFLSKIPAWLHLVSFGGLALGCLLLSRIKAVNNNDKEAEHHTNRAANVAVTVDTFQAEEALTARLSMGSIVLFILSGLFVVIIGAAEIFIRLSK